MTASILRAGGANLATKPAAASGLLGVTLPGEADKLVAGGIGEVRNTAVRGASAAMADHSDLTRPPAARRIFTSRTLNLRAIEAIGYDMDYTLVHYRVEEWERLAYHRVRELLAGDGWPVAHLEFDPKLVIRGLIIDTELGNIVKANRFGYVMRAFHGTRAMTFEEQRETYRHTPIDLGEARFVFLNTLFSLSETCFYAQLVDLLDRGELAGCMAPSTPPGGRTSSGSEGGEVSYPALGYSDLYRQVCSRFDQTHIEGLLKEQISADPEPYVDLDPDAALTLLDQKHAGKRLMLISNSEWSYMQPVMAYAFDRYLPAGTSWRDLFELVIVAANKPVFFSGTQKLFAIDEPSGLLRPLPMGIPGPGLYHGGDAGKVETYLQVSGAGILYVGDHIFADVRMSKSLLRWRTALILRELEQELEALEEFRRDEEILAELMAEKERLERSYCAIKLQLQRLRDQYGPQPAADEQALNDAADQLRASIEALDEQIAPIARHAATLLNPRWGLILRAGNDKSHLARQLERSADIYTSRIANFLYATPYAYLRSIRGSMPHDPVHLPAEVLT
jgi:HAD superfamily 5'-nucleotidase-like hydrolase